LAVGLLLLAGCASSDATGSNSTTTQAAGVASTTAEPTTEEATTEPDAGTSSTTSTAIVEEPDNGEPEFVDAVDGESGDDRTPPTTETPGLEAITQPTVPTTGLTCERLENFGDEALDRWTVVNDGVMGGRSIGEIEIGGGVVRFSGNIDTNGGGFSLMRVSTLRDGSSLEDALGGVDYLQLRVRSANGRGYEFIAEDQSSPSQVMHFAPLPVSAEGLWQEPLIPLADLEARAFGNRLSQAEPFILEEVTSIGVILADGLDGPFSLEINRIDACRVAG